MIKLTLDLLFQRMDIPEGAVVQPHKKKVSVDDNQMFVDIPISLSSCLRFIHKM